MWNFLVRLILRNRIFNIICILILTGVMGYFALKVEMSYEYAQMLPEDNEVNLKYSEFLNNFKQDGNILFVGMQTDKMKQLDFFKDWFSLSEQLKSSFGVKEVFSIGQIVELVKNPEIKEFEIKKLFEEIPETQIQFDSLYTKAKSLKFYEDVVFSSENNVHLMLVWIEDSVLNSEQRTSSIKGIIDVIDKFSVENNVTVHYSGLPYIRTIVSNKIKSELLLFTLLSIVVSMLILLFFFQSFRAVILPMIIVGIGVVWSLGIMVLFGYKISVLTGILPPILIIIGIENCIYILTRYHKEIQHHGGVGRALIRVIQKVGYATLLTNVTTAVGFAAFTITGNKLLVEFGIIASISIILMFVFSLILIPAFYSFFKQPKERHTQYLQKRWVSVLFENIVKVVENKRRWVFSCTIVLLIVGIVGVLLLDQKGSLVDDIPQRDPMYKDLVFFDENLGGVLPYEVTVNTKKNKGLLNQRNIKKIDELSELLESQDAISKPISYVDLLKFAKQSFYNNNPEMYSIPANHERNFIFSYIPKFDSLNNISMFNAYTDSNMQIARVSARMKNLNTQEIEELNTYLTAQIDSIFPPEDYDVNVTGTTVVFLHGSKFLVSNLMFSLLFAVLTISILMYIMFNSIRMVLVSMLPNILPLLMTAGLMGYLGIDIKPSTIIIYSIALGISVDATIHLLSRYRQQLLHNNWNVKESVINALLETKLGMLYSGIVLILGFGVFTLSSFGGTQSLGYLIAFTLTVALFSNLVLLPSLILRFDKTVTTPAFAKSMIEVEEDDSTFNEIEEEK